MTTTFKTISTTQDQALSMLLDEDAEFLPSRVINPKGAALVTEWVNRRASIPQNIDAWLTDAEDSANNSGLNEAVIIEMRGHTTHSGNPETLTLPNDCFDWEVYQCV